MSYNFELQRGKANAVRIPVDYNPAGQTLSLVLDRRVQGVATEVVVATGIPFDTRTATLSLSAEQTRLVSEGPFRLRDANNKTYQTGKVTLEGAAELGSIDAPEIIATVQERIRDEFMGATLDPNLWEVVQTGQGQTITLTGSELRVDSGTTANSTTIIRSKKAWHGAYRVMFVGAAALLSQRIANQTVELRMTNAAGTSYVGWLFDGTSATTGKYRSANGGVSPADTTFTGQQSTAAAGIWEIEAFIDEVYLHSKPADSTTGRLSSSVRNRQIPDPNDDMFIEIRVSNGATAPATSGRLSLDSILVQDISELTTEITAGRGGGGISQSIPTSVVSSVTLSNNVVRMDASATATSTGTFKFISAATTNSTIVRATAASKLYGFNFTNTGATVRYVKFYNKLTAPTVGTDVPSFTVAVPAGQTVNVINTVPLSNFSAGIGMAVTGGYADNDVAAIGAGEVIGQVWSI